MKIFAVERRAGANNQLRPGEPRSETDYTHPPPVASSMLGMTYCPILQPLRNRIPPWNVR